MRNTMYKSSSQKFLSPNNGKFNADCANFNNLMNTLDQVKFPKIHSKHYVIDTKGFTPGRLNKEITSIMKDYKYQMVKKKRREDEEDSKLQPKPEKLTDISTILSKRYQYEFNNEKKKIEKMFTRTKFLRKSNSDGNLVIVETENDSEIEESEDEEVKKPPVTQIQVKVRDRTFSNPMQTYHMLLRNKIIYENMLYNYKNLEKDRFKQTLIKFNKSNPELFSEKRLKKSSLFAPKIKVCPRIPTKQSIPFGKDFLGQKDLSKPKAVQEVMSQILSKILKKHYKGDLREVKVYSTRETCPEGRTEFSFGVDGKEVYMLGGLVSNKTNIVWSFEPAHYKWSKVQQKNTAPELRLAHTSVICNRKLYIYGGKYLISKVLGGLEYFDLDNHIWSPPLINNGERVPSRRNHIACIVGNEMFIHGGLDSEGRFLNDAYILFINEMKWMLADFKSDSPPISLAFHKCCLVLPEEIRINPKLSMYRYPEIARGLALKKANFQGLSGPKNIKERGIYIFGGKIGENGPLLNEMVVIRIGRKPLEWVYLNTVGDRPSCRYSSSINYYEAGNMVVVHGGRNDNTSENYALNDTYLLNLSNLN
ncbi:MAG: hypothetical protein MJ252_13705, partial [archaeon]|nr:hypothetical protein [archaeon]